MKARNPQMALRLDAAPDPVARWRDGAALPYLGNTITLQLDTDRKLAVLEAAVLHLPLPPEATPRQMRDAAEAWLRKQAALVFHDTAARAAASHGRRAPKVLLSFAARSGWIQPEPDCLRCNWHLIEQPVAVIEQVIARAVSSMPQAVVTNDLFAAFA